MKVHFSVQCNKLGRSPKLPQLDLTLHISTTESREWKSQLTFESAMEMPEIKALMMKNEFKVRSSLIPRPPFHRLQ